MGLLDFLSRGDERTAARDEWMRENITPFVPPNLRGILPFVAEMNPVQDVYRAGGNMRAGNYGDAAVDTAIAAAPVVGGLLGNVGAKTLAKGGDDVARATMDTLLGYAPGRSASAADAFVERANQRGPVPDMHMFAGPKAKTADLDAMSRAERMLGEGADRDAVWRDTGWFRGADGKMRFEIDDSQAVNDVVEAAKDTPFPGSTPLGGVIEHRNLYSAYPDLEDVKTYLAPRSYMEKSAPGSYGGITKRGQMVLADDVIDTGRPLHEMQHLVQRQEGFATGGSPYDDGMDFNAYQRLSGEVEARNSEMRSQFDADLRRATPPWQTQDVPDEDQIVRFGTGTQASVANPAQQQAQGILDMLGEGRGADVTDDMMAAADDAYLFRNYDLPMDEASRMQRAREMGFDTETPLYHGTTGGDFQEFDLSRVGSANDLGFYGQGVYTTPNASLASDYAWDTSARRKGSVMPVYTSGDYLPFNQSSAHSQRVSQARYDELAEMSEVAPPELPLRIIDGPDFGRFAEDVGVQGVDVKVDSLDPYGLDFDAPTNERVTFDPANIRSRFARFDPRLSHLRNLSAGLGGVGLLDYLTMPEEQR